MQCFVEVGHPRNTCFEHPAPPEVRPKFPSKGKPSKCKRKSIHNINMTNLVNLERTYNFDNFAYKSPKNEIYNSTRFYKLPGLFSFLVSISVRLTDIPKRFPGFRSRSRARPRGILGCFQDVGLPPARDRAKYGIICQELLRNY